MPSSATRRVRTAILLFVILIASCGGVSENTAGGDPNSDPAGDDSLVIPEVDSPMLADPHVTPWDGGDPAWHLPFSEIQRVLENAVSLSWDESQYPGLPGGCYADGNESGTDREVCLFPVLRDLGVSEDAIRFYETNDLVVMALAGSGPVKVADMWWGPAGAMAPTPSDIFIPGGRMSAHPTEWAPYATALREAYGSDAYRKIVSAVALTFRDGGMEYLSQYPLTIGETHAYRIETPTKSGSSWLVHLTNGLDNSQFAARLSIVFTDEGMPEAASFDGFCFIDEDYWSDSSDSDTTGIEALSSELPTCPARPFEYRGSSSVIDWQNTP